MVPLTSRATVTSQTVTTITLIINVCLRVVTPTRAPLTARAVPIIPPISHVPAPRQTITTIVPLINVCLPHVTPIRVLPTARVAMIFITPLTLGATVTSQTVTIIAPPINVYLPHATTTRVLPTARAVPIIPPIFRATASTQTPTTTAPSIRAYRTQHPPFQPQTPLPPPPRLDRTRPLQSRHQLPARLTPTRPPR